MSIAYSQIPGSIRISGARFEIHSGERPYQGHSRLIFAAPMLPSGSATAGVPIMFPADPVKAFGAGSIAAEIAVFARRQAPLFEMWMLPVADPAGTPGTSKITVNSVPAPGSYKFWLFGRQRIVTVTATDTTSTLATKIATASAASYYLAGSQKSLAMPITAAATAAVTGGSPAPAFVTLTGRHNGPEMNASLWIDFAQGGETSDLAGSVTVTYPVAGSGAVDMTGALAGLGTLDFDWIGSHWDDSGSRSAIANFLADRWNALKMKYGMAVYARQDTVGNLATLGSALNDYTSMTIAQNNAPDPKWAILAQAAADLAQFWDMGSALSEAQVLARPPVGRVLRDLHPPRGGVNGFGDDDRNALYFDGISPLVVDASGNVCFDLVCTSYRVDQNSLDDTNFLWVNYPLEYVYSTRFMKNYVWSRHAGTSFVGDEEPARSGQSRPKDVRSSFALAYLKLENEAGIVENVDGFLARLLVEKSSDPVRCNALVALDVANPFHVLAVNVQASAQFQS